MDPRLAALVIEFERPLREAEATQRRLLAEHGEARRSQRSVLRWTGSRLVALGTKLEIAAGAAPTRRQIRPIPAWESASDR